MLRTFNRKKYSITKRTLNQKKLNKEKLKTYIKQESNGECKTNR